MAAEEGDQPLSEFHIYLDPRWLSAVRRFLASCGAPAEKGEIMEQFLFSDMKTSSLGPPKTKISASIYKSVINVPMVIQLISVLDISRPVYEQYKELTATDDNLSWFHGEDDNEERESAYGLQNQSSSRHHRKMLKLTLTDGFNNFEGMQFGDLACITEETPPGTKILLISKVVCRNGVLQLNDNNCQVLGGDVEGAVDRVQFLANLVKIRKEAAEKTSGHQQQPVAQVPERQARAPDATAITVDSSVPMVPTPLSIADKPTAATKRRNTTKNNRNFLRSWAAANPMSNVTLKPTVIHSRAQTTLSPFLERMSRQAWAEKVDSEAKTMKRENSVVLCSPNGTAIFEDDVTVTEQDGRVSANDSRLSLGGLDSTTNVVAETPPPAKKSSKRKTPPRKEAARISTSKVKKSSSTTDSGRQSARSVADHYKVSRRRFDDSDDGDIEKANTTKDVGGNFEWPVVADTTVFTSDFSVPEPRPTPVKSSNLPDTVSRSNEDQETPRSNFWNPPKAVMDDVVRQKKKSVELNNNDVGFECPRKEESAKKTVTFAFRNEDQTPPRQKQKLVDPKPIKQVRMDYRLARGTPVRVEDKKNEAPLPQKQQKQHLVTQRPEKQASSVTESIDLSEFGLSRRTETEPAPRTKMSIRAEEDLPLQNHQKQQLLVQRRDQTSSLNPRTNDAVGSNRRQEEIQKAPMPSLFGSSGDEESSPRLEHQLRTPPMQAPSMKFTSSGYIDFGVNESRKKKCALKTAENPVRAEEASTSRQLVTPQRNQWNWDFDADVTNTSVFEFSFSTDPKVTDPADDFFFHFDEPETRPVVPVTNSPSNFFGSPGGSAFPRNPSVRSGITEPSMALERMPNFFFPFDTPPRQQKTTPPPNIPCQEGSLLRDSEPGVSTEGLGQFHQNLGNIEISTIAKVLKERMAYLMPRKKLIQGICTVPDNITEKRRCWFLPILVSDTSYGDLPCRVDPVYIEKTIGCSPSTAKAILKKGTPAMIEKLKEKTKAFSNALKRLDLLLEVEFASERDSTPQIVGLQSLSELMQKK